MSYNCRSSLVMKMHVLVCLVFCQLVVAQKSPSPTAAPQARKSEGSFYRPIPGTNDIQQVITTLKRAGLANGKGEFETTAEFGARQGKISRQLGTLVLAIESDDTGFEYDADSGEMVGRFSSSDGSSVIGPKLVLQHFPKKFSQYLGTNSFGVKRMISSYESDEFGIVVHPASEMTALYTSLSDATFRFPMERSDAVQTKTFLRLAVVGRVAEATIVRDIAGREPTLSDPIKTLITQTFVPFAIDKVLVIDRRSGLVITNFVPGHLLKLGAPKPLPSASEVTESAPKIEQPAVSPHVQTRTAPIILRKVDPTFPPLAKQARISGDVHLRVSVDLEGRVQNIMVKSGHPMLVQSALDAVRQYKFRPGTIDGTATNMEIDVEIPFK